jgi:hypothetical protein
MMRGLFLATVKKVRREQSTIESYRRTGMEMRMNVRVIQRRLIAMVTPQMLGLSSSFGQLIAGVIEVRGTFVSVGA